MLRPSFPAARAASLSLLVSLSPLALSWGCSSADGEPSATSTTASGATSAGVGGGGGETGSGGNATGGGFQTAAHEPFPVLEGDPASSMAHVKLVTITYEGYAHGAEVEAFGDVLVGSKWLEAVGADYGVASAEHVAKVILAGPPPDFMDDTDLVNLIDQGAQSGALPLPGSPDPEALYLFYIPPGTTFDDGDGYIVCDGFYGYHWQVQGTTGLINYGVIGDCDGPLEDITGTAAHEFIEASTDYDDFGGYYLQVADDDHWGAYSGYENADLCDYAPYHYEGGFAFQRSWGNAAAAAADGSPCVPRGDGEVFYNVTASPTAVQEVTAGESVTFTLTGWSTAEVADWDIGAFASDELDFEPGFSLDKLTINNALEATLTVIVPPGTPSGAFGSVIVYSGEGYGNYWPVSVVAK